MVSIGVFNTVQSLILGGVPLLSWLILRGNTFETLGTHPPMRSMLNNKSVLVWMLVERLMKMVEVEEHRYVSLLL